MSLVVKETLALFFLTLVVIIPLGYWVYGFFQSPFTFARYCLSCLSNTVSRMIWRVEIDRQLPVPRGQGVILVTNHRSSVDPFFIQVAAHRVVHWMVAKEFVEHPLFAWFLRQTGAIGTSRGGRDTKAIRQTIDLLESGETVGILPEGRINMTTEFMLPIRPGAAMIALKAKVPLLPIYIQGAPYDRVAHSPFFMPRKVRVKIGQVIDLTEYADQPQDESLYRKIMMRVVKQIALMAGEEDFQVTFAGKNWKPTPEELEESYKMADELRKTGKL